ncbi:MAG: alpha/beta fold hydrolase [Candidatus Kariarchaeaceae archaeon]|jgi:pimeloyl-ACP methyl ester carboxylesterase
MKAPKIAYINKIQMHAHSIAVYSKNLEVFQLNVVTNNQYEDRQTILLLHGYLGSVKDYTPFFVKLGHEYNMIAIDLRGHGDSETPKGDWTIEDMVNDVYQVLRLLVPDNKRIVIVGNSLSTAITLKFASEYPELVENIFLISPTTKFSLPLLGSLTARFLNILPNRMITSTLKLMNKSIPKLVRSKEKKEFTKMAMEKIIHVPVSAHKKILRVTLPSYKIDPSELQIPMLIIAGENDTTVPFADSVILNSTAENSSILMLKNTKHRILVNRTNIVLDIFEQWLHTHFELLTDVEHYHENDLITDEDGHRMLPKDWVTSHCAMKH